jgi:parallel beta-helix repeat protein
LGVTIITVNTSQALIKAVATAKDGDVIKLAAGTYSNVFLQGASFLKGITITSADPLHQAVLTDLIVSKSKGLTIQGLDLVNSKNADLPFQITSSSNIVLDRLDVLGTGNSVAALNARLMIIRGSTNVQVTNSEFAYGWHGLSMLNNKQVTIADNYFHDLRTDGVRGGGNSYLTIQANVFTNFHPTATDHPDAIQLWTVNTAGVSSNITIDSNVIVRGSGTPIQGIFLRDTSGTMPFTNITVTNNVIEGARYNGISIGGAQNGVLANNIVQAFSDQPSGIRMSSATGVTVSGNQATTFYTTLKGIAGTAGNALIGVAQDAGAATISAWLKAHPAFATAWQTSDPAVLSSLLNMSGTSGSGLTSSSTSIAAKTAMSLSSASLTTLAPATHTDDDQSTAPATLHKTAGLDPVADSEHGPAADDSGLPPSGLAHQDEMVLLPSMALNDDGGAPQGSADHAPDLDASDGSAGPDAADDDASLILSEDMIASDDAGNPEEDAGGDGSDLPTPAPAAVEGKGGEEADSADAAPHRDVFRFRADDRHPQEDDMIVVGFESGVDKIVISDKGSNAAHSEAQPMSFIGQASFTSHAGEIRYVDGDTGITVQADVNGDGMADLEFSLRDVHSISVRDFIL